ncbi:hypothetical protein F503_02272 [Ophiostoma piceae UAMH 11346]|uniref:Uncharacterized protein n=1 Tax=Ophiostoma piceae (strain UAMH 11346) TaxID=1262450 RepID=S3CGU8_OPHP1|nr:hypothetical protein F503_02272 [Ophiostoma piceae UAMH 11346]
MPAVTTGSATATKPASKRFELPALNFKFAPLTEGTDIPPPLPSPTEEEAPVLKASAKTNGANGADKSSKINGALSSTSTDDIATSPSRSLVRAGLKRTADDVPASPTLSSRPGSIRRLFSRNLLNTAYTNGEEGNAANGGLDAPGSIPRPDSRSDMSTLDDRKSRRSSGWFRRLRGADAYSASATGGVPSNSSPLSKRSSVLFEETKKPAGPPPPMIPELGELQAKIGLDDGSSLGNDLFKNIK